MSEHNTFNAQERAFVLELDSLTRKHGIVIWGCGCCGSPGLNSQPAISPDAGYGTGRADLQWIEGKDDFLWEEFAHTIVRPDPSETAPPSGELSMEAGNVGSNPLNGYIATPEHDPSKSDQHQGLYRKYNVSRVDGKDKPGRMHDGCELFVLDLTHDTHAISAIRAYAESCAWTHPQLAKDLVYRWGGKPVQTEWRCFHCGDVFTDVGEARLHFGHNEMQEPICHVDQVKYREMEALVKRYCDEDTDLHREIHRAHNQGQEKATRAEEAGYARGLGDYVKLEDTARLALVALNKLSSAPGRDVDSHVFEECGGYKAINALNSAGVKP